MYYNKKRNSLWSEIGAGVLFFLILAVGTSVAIQSYANKDQYYYVDNGSGTGYVQLVDRPCIITEIEGDLVTVETLNGGELYAFYGDDYEVGSEIICTFTMANEIIEAK